MTDEAIEAAAKKAGGRWDGSRWVFEDADLHPFARALMAAERERCARLCEPTTPRPCDCERCDCGSSTDARMVAEWDEAVALAKRIRGA